MNSSIWFVNVLVTITITTIAVRRFESCKDYPFFGMRSSLTNHRHEVELTATTVVAITAPHWIWCDCGMQAYF